MTLTTDATVALNRRHLLVGAGAVGSAVVGGSVLAATPATAAPVSAAADLVPADHLLHLLRRASYGPTPRSIAEIRASGAETWLTEQLNPAAIPDTQCDGLLARFPLIGLDITGVRAAVTAGKMKMYGWDAMQQVATAAIVRATWSRRQLFELMVDFWGNHLNVTCPSGAVWDSRQDYDRTVIRAHALGSFADMLKASARHPSMLNFLNNRSSTKAKPNENYGRELLELHTVGLIHTETDVQQAARLLTGLTVDNSTGLYRYNRSRHATGPVRILTFSHANATDSGGEAASAALLDHLALHPATAQRIAHKLCVRFVADEPPVALVTRLAQVYLAGRSAIAPVLRALFTSAEFAAARGAKVRTPLEDVVATVRVLGLEPERVDATANPTGTRAARALYYTVAGAGHAPLAWSGPDGYPDTAAAWASPSGYLARWNAHLNLATGWWPGELTRPASLVTHLLPKRPATYGALVDALAIRLLGMKMRPDHTATLTAFFGKTPTSTLAQRDSALNGTFPHLVALILNSPYFLVR